MVVTALPGPGDIKALTLARDGKAFQICQASNFPLAGRSYKPACRETQQIILLDLYAQSRQFSLFTILLPCILHKRHRT
jgi:hypothetical protein